MSYLKKLEEGAPLIFDEAKEEFSSHLPLLNELASTEQDVVWHAEGNVEIHTRMVLESLEESIAQGKYPYLTDKDLFHLRLATLLHDVAKPLTTRTRVRDGREQVIAPKHAERGAYYIAYRLLALGVRHEDVYPIMGLVRHHHNPKFLVLKDKPLGSYQALARRADVRMLHALEVADLQGRICGDLEDQLEIIELFRLECEDSDVWDRPHLAHREFSAHVLQSLEGTDSNKVEKVLREGIWALERGVIYTPEEAVSRSFSLLERHCNVVFTFGLAGSGKSTWIAEHYPNHEVISLDTIRKEVTGKASDQSQNSKVLEIARERYQQCLRDERDVVWDATNLRADFRSPITALARDYKAHVTQVIFHLDPAEAFRRNRSRDRSVPDSVLDKQLSYLEWPDLDEAHRTLIVDEKGEVRFDSRIA